MNVLSLFDGISCGQVALGKAGIKIDKYFASEIDQFCINITQKNYPKTIQLGDVKHIHCDNLPKINLLMGGSPCQGFSVAGKQLNFTDKRSELFFEYVRILRELKIKNPNIRFLLENVKMKTEYQEIISNILKVRPVLINSAHYSAQNRERIYWTNIPFNSQPVVNTLIIDDILDKQINPTLEVTTQLKYIPSIKHGSMLKQVGYFKADKQGWRVYGTHGKSPTLIADSGGLAGPGNALIFCNGKIRKMSIHEVQKLQTLPVGYTDGPSRGKQHRAIGNGWTVNVIARIFTGL